MKTLFENQIPAVPFYRILRQYARAKGLPFLTHLEKRVVLKFYLEEAVTKN